MPYRINTTPFHDLIYSNIKNYYKMLTNTDEKYFSMVLLHAENVNSIESVNREMPLIRVLF